MISHLPGKCIVFHKISSVLRTIPHPKPSRTLQMKNCPQPHLTSDCGSGDWKSLVWTQSCTGPGPDVGQNCRHLLSYSPGPGGEQDPALAHKKLMATVGGGQVCHRGTQCKLGREAQLCKRGDISSPRSGLRGGRMVSHSQNSSLLRPQNVTLFGHRDLADAAG